jgi:phosphopantothenoylcysteine decarboxylase/phosphopantothenate--cysteine ligase
MPSATPNSPAPRIVLGVAGGIAAYKSVELLRLLRDAGYFVSPVLTPDAVRFVGAETFSALASEPTRSSLYGDVATPIPHTYLAQHADVIVVAPATAHLIARYAMGLSDDLLTATLLASRGPVLLCPAMHTEMWEQPSVQENLVTLRRRGVLVLNPETGALAGGDEGAGRLPEPEVIFALIEKIVRGFRGPLSGKRLLITAGGTREPIDPVRVLTNRSSGRQGHALAEVAQRLGARVTLITTSDLALALDVAGDIDVVHVDTAAQMHDETLKRWSENDAVIMAAAIADFTVTPAKEKLKKHDGPPVLSFVATADVVLDLVAAKSPGQIVVGFGAETTDVVKNGLEKLARKGVDMLVVNDVSAPGSGFAHETNEVVILDQLGGSQRLTLRSKEAISLDILSRVASMFAQGDQ